MSDTLRLVNLGDTSLLSEEELLSRARDGDKTAFGALYLRHKDSARKVAGMCTSSAADAEDAVAEGFARVFAALPRMNGREIVFRPYLLTCVRNAATDRIRRERRIDLRESLPDTPGQFTADDVAMLGVERNLVGEALQALPDRWRTVLWLTEVEGLSPAEVSERIGIKPNAVAALAYRARKGLREAYLQAHLRAEASQECRGTVSRLGNYVRGELAERERQAVQVHLDACAKCRGRRDELTDVNATLRHALLPVPLLLAGMERKWFSLTQISGWWSKGSELGLAQVADSPLANKALAGVAVVALALGGSAVPKLTRDHAAQDTTVQQASAPAPAPKSAPPTSIRLNADPLASGPMSLELMVTPFLDGAGTGAPAGTGTVTAASADAPSSVTPAGGRAGAGETRNRIFPSYGHTPEGDSERAGNSRQRLLDPGPGPGSGGDESRGPLAGTAVQTILESVVDTVDALLPLDVSLSVPGIAEVTTGGGRADLGGVSLGTDGVRLDVAPLLGGLTGARASGAPAPAAPAPAGASLLSPLASPGLLGGVADLLTGLSTLVTGLVP